MIAGTRLLLACGSNAFLPTAKAAISSAHASLALASLTSGSAWQEMSGQTQRVSAWGEKTTRSCQGTSRSFASSSEPVDVDPFRESLQRKTEVELGEIIQQKIQMGKELAAAAMEGEGEEEEEDEMVNMVNQDTGEYGGPRGKEPTRFEMKEA
eukprot:gene22257-29327_t